MPLKDYYQILDLTRNATEQEIRKAYRRLAMKYHPDKNAGSEYAEAHFREVKEAYQVLSDPHKRSAYNQQRWYRQSARNKSEEETFTPQVILKKCRDLNRYIDTLDAFSINNQSLFQYIILILNESSIKTLADFDDPSSNRQIIHELLKASRSLPYGLMEKMGARLARVAGKDSQTIQLIEATVKERRFSGFWQKYHGIIILIITLILCWIIYDLSE